MAMDPRRRAPRWQSRPGGGGEPACCGWPGCEAEGLYPAPRGRDQLRDFQWLCLDHVREFNRHWDYFKGMGRDEIEAHLRADVTWHRPSWRIAGRERAWHDVFGVFDEEPQPRHQPARPRTRAEEMMDRLELSEGFTLDELKSRYKALAKRHHPDLNGGDKAAEERLKMINEAYSFLREQSQLVAV